MKKQSYIIVTKTSFEALDDVEARQFARLIEKAVHDAHRNNICMSTSLEVKLQRQVPGNPPERVQF